MTLPTEPPTDATITALRPGLHVHVVGVGGAGMSSIATILAEMGLTVSGSDARDSASLRRLQASGVATFVGHAPNQIAGADLVLRSSAVGAGNPEVAEATRLGIPVLNRTMFLPLFAAATPFVSVTGTHGKTTTSSMTAVVLDAVGARPSYLIGSVVHTLGSSGAHGSGRLMVLEADESDGSFLAGPRAASLVTNVEADHLDFWGSWDALVVGVRRFVDETDGPRVLCADDPTLSSMIDEFGAIGYGFADTADYRITALETERGRSIVHVMTPDGPMDIALAVPGRYNAMNATGALALVHSLGFDPDAIVAGLESYRGVARRFEQRGSVAGIDFVDDYAHHPTELRAVLDAALSGGWGRVVATFQPHRYTRTESLWNDFVGAFSGVDLLVVTDIYPAGEQPRPGIDARLLASAVAEDPTVARVEYRATLAEAADLLASELRAGDLALSLGAGDVTALADLVIERLGTHGATPGTDRVDGNGSGNA